MKAFLTGVVFFLISSFIFSQKVIFHINPGFIVSQVDGDSYGGFKKLGYNLGAGFRLNIKENNTFLDWGTRLNQKGFREVNPLTYDLIRLNYLETDIIYATKIGTKVELGAGAYYGHLLFDEKTVRTRDIAPVFRVGLRVHEKLVLQSRFSYSVLSIREKNYSRWLNRAILFEISWEL